MEPDGASLMGVVVPMLVLVLVGYCTSLSCGVQCATWKEMRRVEYRENGEWCILTRVVPTGRKPHRRLLDACGYGKDDRDNQRSLIFVDENVRVVTTEKRKGTEV